MKRGFTLVELLSVIVIISIISVIVFPLITSYIDNSKTQLLGVQIKDIEDSAKKWATDNIDKLDKYHINDIYVDLPYIKQQGYLEKDDILNPKTKEVMEGCVAIKYDSKNKQYTYKYDEIDCNSGALDSDSYIVYSYDDEKAEIIENINNYHTPFYLDLIDNNNLKVLGQTESGLYDLENEFVFKGSDVNNYANFAGKVWRILSIDKDDYSIRLVSISGTASLWSQEVETDFSKSTSKGTLEESVSSTKLDDNWYSGIINNSEMSVASLRNKLTASTMNVKVGLLSVYDYVLASNCNDNFLSSSCATNNYLTTMFSGKNVWTTNTDGSSIWYINATGSLALAKSDAATYYLYPVIKLPVSIYATNMDSATGSNITDSTRYNLK